MADRPGAVAGVVHRQDAAQPRPWKSRADRVQLRKPVMKGDVMLVDGVALRECVLEYAGPNGETWRELVPLQTIEDSAGGIAHLPVTLGHPDADVDEENVGELSVGNVGGVVRIEDEGFTIVQIAVRKKSAKDAIRQGTQELSLKYDAQVDPTPGVHPDHGRYDAVQVARSNYNHIALVDQARVGPDARIRADGVSTTCIRADTAHPTPGKARGATMNTGFLSLFALLGIAPRRCDSDDAAIAAIEGTLRARKDAEEAMAAAAETEEAAADAETSRLQAALDTATQSLAAVQAELDALKGEVAVEADKADRAALLPLATALKVDAAQHPKTKDLRKAIATAHFGGKLRADATDAYVDAAVDQALLGLTAKGDGREAGSKVWVQPPGEQHAGDGLNTGGQGSQPRLSPLQKVQAKRAAARAGGAS